MARPRFHMPAHIDEDGSPPDWLVPRLLRFLSGHMRGKRVEIEAREERRTNAQNRYYWGVVIATIKRAMARAGRDAPDMAWHVKFKGLYLPPRVLTICDPATGEVLEEVVEVGSTKSLTVSEMTDYIEAILSDDDVVAALGQAGVAVPSPDDYQTTHGKFTKGITEPD